jgi:hypothetical protein
MQEGVGLELTGPAADYEYDPIWGLIESPSTKDDAAIIPFCRRNKPRGEMRFLIVTR